MTFDEKVQAIAEYDAKIAFWKEHTRPLCFIHEKVSEISLWEFIQRSWKMKERCPKCRGYYTKRGMPPAPPNMLDLMLSVTYGPALIQDLNAKNAVWERFFEQPS